MARVLAQAETHPEPTPRPPQNGRETALAHRFPTAFRLTDQHARRAYVWWQNNPVVPVVDADDPVFRRRVLRALKRPIWVLEDERDENGLPLTTRVLLQPDDPRYPSRLLFRWHQIGLRDLTNVDVVRRDTRELVETRRGAGG